MESSKCMSEAEITSGYSRFSKARPGPHISQKCHNRLNGKCTQNVRLKVNSVILYRYLNFTFHIFTAVVSLVKLSNLYATAVYNCGTFTTRNSY